MKWPRFLSALAYRDYRLLWSGAFLSSIGTWTQDVALAWLIHSRWDNPVYLGLRAFAADAPLIAFMLVGGAVADRVDRRHILLASNVLQMVFAAALAVLYAVGALGIAPILALAFLTGLTQSQSAPTYQAVLTSLVPAQQIPTAVALNSLQFNLSRAVGPMIAGLLLARAGTLACLLVNVLSFAAVILAIRRIQMPLPAPGNGESFARSLRTGLRHVRDHPVLAGLTTLGALGSFLAFPLVTYLPVLAGDVLRTGAAGYSLLLTSFGVGAIAGALATAQRGNVPGRGRVLLKALMAYGLFSAGAMAVRSQAACMVLLFLAGASMVTAFSTLNSLVQENAAAAVKGRVLSIYGVAFRGGMPLGAVAAGLAVRELGVPWVMGGYSVVLLLVAAAQYAWNPRIRDL
jgi:predicted MFS family arabinose efflux permease